MYTPVPLIVLIPLSVLMREGFHVRRLFSERLNVLGSEKRTITYCMRNKFSISAYLCYIDVLLFFCNLSDVQCL